MTVSFKSVKNVSNVLNKSLSLHADCIVGCLKKQKDFELHERLN